MTTRYTTRKSLTELRETIFLLSLPRPRVLWRVFDSLDAAINSMTHMSEYKRVSVIARYHDPAFSRLMFVLVFKR